jgi:AcrR family transcriptional regulator
MPRRAQTSPRKTASQQRSRATVDALVEATARVLVDEGYERASTNRIAAVAGVSIGSLYQYFPSKEALVAALIDRHMAHMTALLEASIDSVRGASLPVATRTLVDVMIAAHAHNPKLHKVVAEQVPRVGRLNRSHDIERQMAERIHAVLSSRRGEIRPENLDLAVFLIVSVVESLTHRATVDNAGAFDTEELACEVTDLVLRYVMREPPAFRPGDRAIS